MMIVVGDVVKQLYRPIQHRDHSIDVSVIIDVSKGDSAVRSGSGEVGPCFGTYIFEFAIAEVAEHGIRPGILAFGNQTTDIVQNVRACDEQVLPSIVVEVKDSVSPA